MHLDAREGGNEQALPEHLETSVFDYVATGLAETGALLSRYHALAADGSAEALHELSQIQAKLEHLEGWRLSIARLKAYPRR